MTGATVVTLRRLMGKYGIDPTDLVGIVSVDAWYDLLEDPNFADVIELGANAQKLTGQVGSMYGVPFIVSPEMATKANTAIGMILVNTRNYLVPRRRGVTVQSWYDVEKQRKVLVATQRWGFNSIMTTGKSVAVAKYVT
jgi:N4-gp56 family major capsid protein